MVEMYNGSEINICSVVWKAETRSKLLILRRRGDDTARGSNITIRASSPDPPRLYVQKHRMDQGPRLSSEDSV